jgi:hypothetical protein
MKTRCDLVEDYTTRIWSSVLEGVGREDAPPILPAIRFHLHEMLKEQGTAQVLENNQAWQDQVLDLLKWLASTAGSFTSDDLRDVCKMASMPGPRHVNAWGAVLSHAAKQGLIVREGYRVSTRPEAHGRVVSVWRGK